MTDDNENYGDPAPISRPSFSFVGIILLGVGIFFLGPLITKTGALALLLLLVAFVLWQALAAGPYEKMKASYPDMERSFWIINNLVYHLLIPGALFAVLYLFFHFRH